MTFENKLARYRKVSEHLDELKDIVDGLKGEKEMLEHEILVDCANDLSKYNVFVRRNCAAGLVGHEYFMVKFADTLVRSRQGARLDDQEWLSGISPEYTKCRLSLMKSKVNADFSEGNITEDALRGMGLKYDKEPSLTAKRIPDDASLEQVKRDAETLVSEV